MAKSKDEIVVLLYPHCRARTVLRGKAKETVCCQCGRELRTTDAEAEPMDNALFRRIKDGADTISKDAFTCYGLWRDDNLDDAVEVAERIVLDARTLTKQAEDVLEALDNRRT